MKTIPINQVIVESDRQRKEFDQEQLQLLADDIAHSGHGLLHPILLREGPDGAVLVAGERRLRAVADLWALGLGFTHGGEPVPEGHIPYIMLGNLSYLSAQEVEFAENEIRTQLTWQERAAANAKLMALRTMQAEQRGEEPPTVADLSLEVRGKSVGNWHDITRKELLIAPHLDDPDVKKATSVQEAFKILHRKEEAKKNAELAELVGTSYVSQHVCLNADSLEWMATQPDNYFNVVITDPPYGMGADEFGDSGKVMPGAHGYEDSEEYALQCYETLAAQSFRITATEAHAYVFCDIDWFHTLRSIFTEAGWRVFRTPLLWFKPAAYRAPWPEHGPQRKYECILFAIKGDKRTLRLAGDVVTCPPDENLGHAAQKPVALFQDLLSRSARPGDKVLDPFCGTGPVFEAAHNLKAIATGVELSPTSYGIAVQRLQELTGGAA